MKWNLLLVTIYFASMTPCIANGEEQVKSYNSLCIKKERPDTRSGLSAEEDCLQQEAEQLRQKWNKLYHEGHISSAEQDWLMSEKILTQQRTVTLAILEQQALSDLSVLEQWVAKAILFVTDELLMPQFFQASNEAIMEFIAKIKTILDTKSQELSPAQPNLKQYFNVWVPLLQQVKNIETQKEHLISYLNHTKATFLTAKDKEYLLDNLLYIQFDMAHLQVDTELVKLQNNIHEENKTTTNKEQNNMKKQQLLKQKETIQALQKHCFTLIESSSLVSSHAKHKQALQQKINCAQQLL